MTIVPHSKSRSDFIRLLSCPEWDAVHPTALKFFQKAETFMDLTRMIHVARDQGLPVNEWLLWYAINNPNHVYLEIEDYFSKEGNRAYDYAVKVLRQRWVKAEPCILSTPRACFYYSQAFGLEATKKGFKPLNQTQEKNK